LIFSMPTKNSNGRFVVIGLLIFSLIGFGATVWNYSRNNPMSRDARLETNGNPSIVTAKFDNQIRVKSGQRVVVRIDGDTAKAHTGLITSVSPDGLATIQIDATVTAQPPAKASVSIDGTVAPEPSRP
jgi:multidrug resistance efflux pump